MKLIPNRQSIVNFCRNKHVLDFGCSGDTETGLEITSRISKVASSYHGFDVDLQAVKRLQQAGIPVSVFNLDAPIHEPLNSLVREEQKDMLILMSEVIEHLPNPGKTLSWLRDWCVNMKFQNPRLLVGTPNVYSTLLTLKFWLTGNDDDSDHHFLRFSPKNLNALLRHTGWEPVDAWFYYPDTPGIPYRWLRVLLPHILRRGSPGFIMLNELSSPSAP